MADMETIRNELQSIIAEITESEQLPENFLATDDNQNNGKVVSISLNMYEPINHVKAGMILRAELSGKKNNKKYTFAVKVSDLEKFPAPDCTTKRVRESAPDYVFLDFPEITPEMQEFAKNLTVSAVLAFEPSEKFGCCHRFKQCSDAKQCIHPNQFYAKACWYRRNLENGKVFY